MIRCIDLGRIVSALVASACVHDPTAQLLAHAPDSPFAMPDGAHNVMLGDLDRDGHLDLLVATGKQHRIAIFRGDGKGRFDFGSSSNVALDFAPGEIVLQDLNEDGVLDLAVANHDSFAVVLLLGDGKGGFAPAPGSPAITGSEGRPHNHGVVFGDVNHDGHLDLVAVNSESDNVAVLLGDGHARFTAAPGSPFPGGPSPYPPALGDVDGDGNLDIALPDTGTGRYSREHGSLARTITLLLGDGKGSFRPAPGSPIAVTEGPYYVALGDLDGDGRPDLVAAHDDSNFVSILLNDGNGNFRPTAQSPFDLGRRAWKIVVLDANRDGKADLALANGDGVALLLGDGHGTFAQAPGSPFAVGKGAWRLAVGDVNEDGKLDVVTSNLESNSVSLLLGQ